MTGNFNRPEISDIVVTAQLLVTSWRWIKGFKEASAGQPLENEWEIFVESAVSLRDQLSNLITSWGLDETEPINLVGIKSFWDDAEKEMRGNGKDHNSG